jgi:hypothetical protein
VERENRKRIVFRKNENRRLVFLLLLSMKLAPIYRAGKRVILSSTGKSISP